MVANTMICMYAKYTRINKAWTLFDNMHDANIVSWITMIPRNAKNEFFQKALHTWEECIDIHQSVVENSFSINIMIMNVIIDMYIKYARIQKDVCKM